jgi:undecaprenyl-diphosphatase
MPDVIIGALLGLVEGLTEFVPVSSTGHLIIAGSLLGFEGERAATFEVFIQLGAILAVAWVYRNRLRALADPRPAQGFAGRRGLGLLLLTTLPALVLGALTHQFIRSTLFDPRTVAVGLGLGGVAILLAERFRPEPTRTGLDALGWQVALVVGLFQCFALWPGVSRSAATMVGGLLVGVERKTAAEYSFLAAIPVISAASLFELATSLDRLTTADIPLFVAGFGVAFGSAWLAVTFFLRLISHMTLRPFGWYRIGAALLLALLFVRGGGF